MTRLAKLRFTSLGLACAGGLGAQSFAQSPPAGDLAPPPAMESGAPMQQSGPDGGARALVQSCREKAKASGLRGPERRAQVIDCVKAQDPRAAARMVCNDRGRAKGFSGPELKSFVRSCKQ